MGIVEHAFRLVTDDGILQDVRVFSVEVPGLEEGRPIDERHQIGQGIIAQREHPQLLRGCRFKGKIGAEPLGARGFQRHKPFFLLADFVLPFEAVVIGPDLGAVGLSVVAEQLLHHGDGTGSVVHVDQGAGISRLNFYSGVHPRSRGAANEQRQADVLALHLPRHKDHFVQGGGDESAEANGIHAVGQGFVQDFLGGHHHAQVDDFKIVALEDHPHNVLADVVDVAFDCGEQNFALFAGGAAGFAGGCLKIRFQPRHRALHNPSGLDHLRQKHFSGTKQVPHRIHAAHQRTFDDGQRTAQGVQRFRRIGFDVGVDAVDQGMFHAFFHRKQPPGLVLPLSGGSAVAFEGFCQRQQSFAGLVVAVKQNVLNGLPQGSVHLFVHHQLTGVDNSHVQAVPDGVVQKTGVDGLAHGVVAAETETDVAHPAGNQGPRQMGLDPGRGFKEIQGIAPVFFHARGYGENIGVEDNVFRGETRRHQQTVGPFADFDPARQGVCLPLLVKRHDHHRGSVPTARPRLAQKFVLPGFQRDGVDNSLSLQAPQSRLDDFPTRRVNHKGNPRNVRFRRQQV